jgi:hypothetical protein
MKKRPVGAVARFPAAPSVFKPGSGMSGRFNSAGGFFTNETQTPPDDPAAANHRERRQC